MHDSIDIELHTDAQQASDAVQQAAAALRHNAFHAMYDNCSSCSCHHRHVGALHNATDQLQDSMETLMQQYQHRNKPVPDHIEAKFQEVVQAKAHIGLLHGQAAERTATTKACHEPEHMQPLVKTLHLSGQLTHRVMQPEQESTILRRHRRHTAFEHTSAKIAELQNVNDNSILCKRIPFMCQPS